MITLKSCVYIKQFDAVCTIAAEGHDCNSYLIHMLASRMLFCICSLFTQVVSQPVDLLLTIHCANVIIGKKKLFYTNKRLQAPLSIQSMVSDPNIPKGFYVSFTDLIQYLFQINRVNFRTGVTFNMKTFTTDFDYLNCEGLALLIYLFHHMHVICEKTRYVLYRGRHSKPWRQLIVKIYIFFFSFI